jgi:hypothetical protein
LQEEIEITFGHGKEKTEKELEFDLVIC